ncbi:DNA primase [Streptococcus loxodontisalivarius]|uniref:DNA primase n=1 Tax=Streptococcus loxodontisalivarius TaxID=1349415 RepID=A0ABS2PVX5_9STRE|nr:DNA primase [Streptococcus loxodontisalivarius]MBM7643447.1 DNA primase [Streptococcus loxodontisalivarius]
MYLNKETIADIKQSTNIVDIIGEVVSLTKSGRNYLGLCPFHKEKTPSFNVLEDKQFYHCFGCGRSGDVFKFLEDYRQITFAESASVLAERLGMSLQVPSNQLAQVRQESPHQKLFEINQDAERFYQAVLKTTKIGELARQYLYSRGITDEVIEEFHIGLAPAEPDYLYQSLSKKFDETTVMNSGLFNLSERSNRFYDAFQNRIIFPLRDENGRVIGFSGRIWQESVSDDQQPQAKYKNTRATAIFNKSYELYHLDKAKAVMAKTHEVYLMEGFMDVIAAHRAGIDNAVASMGTALTPEHVNHLKKFTKKVIVTYDGDKAGQNAIAKSLELLGDFTVDIVRLPEQMDPDEYLQKNSPEELEKLLRQSRISQVEFLMHYLLPENSDNLQAEIDYVDRMAALIVQTPSITAQNSYITKVADLLPDFDYFQVEQAVNNQRLLVRGQMSQAANQTQAAQTVMVELPVSKQVSALRRAENQLFHRMLNHAYVFNDYRMRSDFHFETAELQTLFELLNQEGELDSFILSGLDNDVQSAYYAVLEERLPEEVTDGELQELDRQISRLLAQQEIRKQGKRVRETTSLGDQDGALLALEALIAQKRNLE